jgi:hypothetical protein
LQQFSGYSPYADGLLVKAIAYNARDQASEAVYGNGTVSHFFYNEARGWLDRL